MKALIAAAVLVVLSGCTTLGLTPAQNTQEQIAYAYSGITAALNTLAQATTAGVVTSREAVVANTAILAVKAQLDQAELLVNSNEPTAVRLLTAATSALTQISAYFTCKQQKEAACQL